MKKTIKSKRGKIKPKLKPKRKRIFLSSTTDDLRDVRTFLIERIPKVCPGIDLISFEKHSQNYPGKLLQDICILLAKQCDGVLLLIDKHYGSSYKKNRKISITHAEANTALKNNKFVIPIVSMQTWHEFQIWKLNKTRKIVFANVKDPNLFQLLRKIENQFMHIFDSFTGKENLKKIIKALNAIANGAGLIDHLALT